ncbi:hypothetical protein GCM10027285_20820 [Oleiagrimonas citrea]
MPINVRYLEACGGMCLKFSQEICVRYEDRAFTAPLAVYSNLATQRVDITKFQCNEFGNPNARGGH